MITQRIPSETIDAMCAALTGSIERIQGAERMHRKHHNEQTARMLTESRNDWQAQMGLLAKSLHPDDYREIQRRANLQDARAAEYFADRMAGTR